MSSLPWPGSVWRQDTGRWRPGRAARASGTASSLCRPGTSRGRWGGCCRGNQSCCPWRSPWYQPSGPSANTWGETEAVGRVRVSVRGHACVFTSECVRCWSPQAAGSARLATGWCRWACRASPAGPPHFLSPDRRTGDGRGRSARSPAASTAPFWRQCIRAEPSSSFIFCSSM